MKAKLILLSLLIAALVLTGCGSKAAPEAAQEAPAARTAVSTAEPAPATAEPTETPKVTLPDGTSVSADTLSVDLSKIGDSGVDAAVEALGKLPSLQIIYLGSERGDLSWDSVSRIAAARGNADIDFAFRLYGKEFHLADTRVDINHIPVSDNGDTVKTVCPLMYALRSLDMDYCGVADCYMQEIRELLPECEVIWRIWFGDTQKYSVRTDTERILASMPSMGCILAPGTYDSLKYCTKVKYLDIGFNSLVDEIDFAAYMPELEVLIITKNSVTDISPLKFCKKLEYLEMANNYINDLSPLSGLDSLRHLNFCNNPGPIDISPLYPLKGLDRIWIGGNNNVSDEQIKELLKQVPNASVDNTCNEYYEHWFYDWERYWKAKEQFGNYEFEAYSFEINDPKA